MIETSLDYAGIALKLFLSLVVVVVTLIVYRVGDRIRVGDVVGDVMDISLARTTVMEVGEWVKADQYTGRVVTVANRVVWVNPVYNFT